MCMLVFVSYEFSFGNIKYLKKLLYTWGLKITGLIGCKPQFKHRKFHVHFLNIKGFLCYLSAQNISRHLVF
jgi:hypothetical protein